jgi:hypothetical protein
MKTPITTINRIDIFKIKQYGQEMFMLKKGWTTIGLYYTLKEAKQKAKTN